MKNGPVISDDYESFRYRPFHPFLARPWQLKLSGRWWLHSIARVRNAALVETWTQSAAGTPVKWRSGRKTRERREKKVCKAETPTSSTPKGSKLTMTAAVDRRVARVNRAAGALIGVDERSSDQKAHCDSRRTRSSSGGGAYSVSCRRRVSYQDERRVLGRMAG